LYIRKKLVFSSGEYMIDFKKDLIISAVIGLLCALLILPIAKILEMKQSLALSLLVVLPVLSVAGMFAAYWLAKKIKVFYQIAKFILVGALNSFVDWGILNLLMFLTSIVAGGLYPVFKGISFLIATTNSYFWNKFWTFRSAADVAPAFGAQPQGDGGTVTETSDNVGSGAGNIGTGTAKEPLRFFIVSFVGFLLNIGIATFLVNILGPKFGFSAALWANIGAIAGTLLGMVWNFVGYKLVVFKQ